MSNDGLTKRSDPKAPAAFLDRPVYRIGRSVWVRGHRYDYLRSVASRYGPIVRDAATKYQVDPELVLAIISQESGGDHTAQSHKGARGLMQLMPDTARSLGVQDPHDPVQNIHAGVRYLRMQLDRFGRIDHALAAYNAGPGNVRRYNGVPPFKETQNYVLRILYGPDRKPDQDDRALLQPDRLNEPNLIWWSIRAGALDPQQMLHSASFAVHALFKDAVQFDPPPGTGDPDQWPSRIYHELLKKGEPASALRRYQWNAPHFDGLSWTIPAVQPAEPPIRVWVDRLGYVYYQTPWSNQASLATSIPRQNPFRYHEGLYDWLTDPLVR